MNVSLPPELERSVKDKVASGLYANASEVVCEALRLSLKSDRENTWLKRQADIGYAQLETGATVKVTNKEEFLALARAES